MILTIQLQVTLLVSPKQIKLDNIGNVTLQIDDMVLQLVTNLKGSPSFTPHVDQTSDMMTRGRSTPMYL